MIPVNFEEVIHYLGYKNGARPDSHVSASILRCERQLQKSVMAKNTYREFPFQCPDKETTEIAGVSFHSRDLVRHLRDCSSVILFAATLGIVPDRMIARAENRNMGDAMILQALSAVMILEYTEQIYDQIRKNMSAEHLYIRTGFSPGYGDLNISCQPDVLHMLQTQKKIGLTLTDSLMMMPTKSITSFIGITSVPQKERHNGCKYCTKTDCEFRRVS